MRIRADEFERIKRAINLSRGTEKPYKGWIDDFEQIIKALIYEIALNEGRVCRDCGRINESLESSLRYFRRCKKCRRIYWGKMNKRKKERAVKQV